MPPLAWSRQARRACERGPTGGYPVVAAGAGGCRLRGRSGAMVVRSRDGGLRKVGPRVLSAIGRQEWLDRPSYRFEHLLSFGYNALGAANTVTNALNGVWLGHPVHPPLASLTSGALGTTVALDALSLLPGQPPGEVRDASRFATRALGVGILASVGSAVTASPTGAHPRGGAPRRHRARAGEPGRGRPVRPVLVGAPPRPSPPRDRVDRPRLRRHPRRQLPRRGAGVRVRDRHRPVG